MARLDSYNKQALKALFDEHARTAKNYKNEVDLERSYLNFGYGFATSSDEAKLQTEARVADIMQGQTVQKQTNLISEWVITYPATECEDKTYTISNDDGTTTTKHYNSPIDANHCKQFFDEVYEFACNRYGKENVIAGWVNMDETTPHMHLDIVPEAISRKNGKRTVSSASRFTRKELSSFHRDLQKHMNKVFGKNDYILNGATKENLNADQLKARQEQQHALEEREANLALGEEWFQKRKAQVLEADAVVNVKASNAKTLLENAKQKDEEADYKLDKADKRLLEAKQLEQQCFEFFKQLRTLDIIDNLLKTEEDKKQHPLSLLELATVLMTGVPKVKQHFKERSIKEMDKQYASKIQFPPKKTSDGYDY